MKRTTSNILAIVALLTGVLVMGAATTTEPGPGHAQATSAWESTVSLDVPFFDFRGFTR